MTEYKVGDKVVIKGDSVAHGFPVGTEVYLVGQQDSRSTTWLASEDRDAEPVWTGRFVGRSGSPVVMNVDVGDMQPALADWEKELLEPDSTAHKPVWTELEVGDTVTIKYLPTEQKFITKVLEGKFSDLNVLGWAFDNEYDPGFEDVELLSVEKAPKPEPFKLPTTLWSQIEVTFIGAEQREVRHCVLVRNADGDSQWLIVSMDGKPVSAWHDARWLEEGVNRPVPMYEIEVLFEAKADD